MNMNTTPLEAETRVLIDRSLENLGWKLKGKDKNVFFEQPKTELERKKLGGKRPDYVLYSKESEKPLIVIEAKKKGSRIDEALEQGIGYARAIDAPLVFATDGVFCKAFHTGANRPPILNGEEVDEFIREALALRYLTSYEVNTVSPKVQYDRKELIRIFDEANNMLRGEGLRAGIERFGEFANILFLKLISESEQAKKERGEPTKFNMACSWDAIKGIPASTRIEYINKTVYDKLNALYETDIFTPLQIKDTGILKDIMDKLDPLMLTDVDSDVKGDAFEYFLKASTSTKNDLGEYFTPRHIVKTMVRLVNPQIGEKIYDPFCGTGGFLIESFRYIYNNMARTDANLALLRENTVYGNEITNTARITKMNMILAGDGHSNIEMKDSLANPVDGTETYMDESGKIHHRGFDIVLANMPYSQKTKYGSLYDLPSTNGDSICVQHCMKAINSAAPNGRMALVVPEGFLFRKDLTKTREYLLDHCQLQSIISLPQGVFLPYTGVKTDIIYATKVNQKVKSSEKKKTFWYFDVKSDGYTLDNHRRKLDFPSDLSKYEEYRKLDEDQATDMLKVGFEMIPLDKVRQNSNILVGSRYRVSVKRSNYETVCFSDIATLVRGVNYKKQQQTTFRTANIILPADNITLEGDLKVQKEIYVDDTVTLSDDKRLQKNDIFICMSSGSKEHIGKVAFIDQDTKYYAGGFMGIIRVNMQRCLPKFLYYYLNYSMKFREEIKLLTQGANINNISSTINSIEIPLPPIDVQERIITELDGYQQVVNGARSVLSNYRPKLSCSTATYKTLDEIATFRPSKDEIKALPGDTDVSFVPMASLNTFDASFEAVETRKLTDVSSGFTYFRNNDILLAKITPCFENGKAGIAHNLKNGIGFGSTEYIVIRADESVIYPEWIFYYINTREFIDGGKPFMTGTAGQQRIDINYVKQYQIPVPSLEEQKMLLDEIHREQALIKPSKQIIDVFTAKIDTRIKEIWGE
ncbi:type I restriction modification DNA specificity domain protein [Clostridium sp. CAG:81]|nr:type I restriction modification DNA specificity domain protein [Clostridium sp. CAG:81]